MTLLVLAKKMVVDEPEVGECLADDVADCAHSCPGFYGRQYGKRVFRFAPDNAYTVSKSRCRQ